MFIKYTGCVKRNLIMHNILPHQQARPREEPPESETVVPAQRGRPRKKQKQETSSKLSREVCVPCLWYIEGK